MQADEVFLEIRFRCAYSTDCFVGSCCVESKPRNAMSGADAARRHEEGYIEGYDVEDTVPQKTLHITLKYGPKKAKIINGIRRISKPGLRKYTGVADMPRVRGGLGTAIISTSHGVMTDRDARKHNVGGEIIAYVW